MTSRKRLALYDEASRVATLRKFQHNHMAMSEMQLATLGDRLANVKVVLDRANSMWARNYWSQVHTQLQRRISHINQGM